MDLIVTTERFPNAGETVLGNGFCTAPGGKGANQAVQAARLGADVTMFGKVGNDDFGKALISSVKGSGVNVENILITSSVPTAIGNVQIQSNQNGTENRIIVVSGANMELTPNDVDVLKDEISNFDIVILQNEIPVEVNLTVAKYAKSAGVPVMLNPAPSAKLPKELITCLTFISPNEHETEDIVGIVPHDETSRKAAVDRLMGLGVENVLITLGKNGCVFCNGQGAVYGESVDCGKVVDCTAAGDSFIGAFCTALASGITIKDTLVFANCTAGITVSRMGAQTSLPTLDEVLALMKKKEINVEPYLN